MGKILKHLKQPKKGKKKVSFMLTEETLEKIEALRGKVKYQSKSEFMEKLLEYALMELERDLKKSKREEKQEEKWEEKQEEKQEQKRGLDKINKSSYI